MNRSRLLILIFKVSLFVYGTANVTEGRSQENDSGDFFIGWSSVDITPKSSVFLNGQYAARVSEGVMDPITATASGDRIRKLGRNTGKGNFDKL